MFTFRNMVALGLFLFGTTFLWLTPSFLGVNREVADGVWSVVQILVLLTILGFSIAAWGVFKELHWWEPLAIGSGVIGLVVLVPYWMGARQVAGAANVGSNLAVHAFGSVVLVLLLITPLFHKWLTARL